MAIPLILQFFIGLTMQGVFTVLSTLLVDTHPDSPSTAQGASNLVRCELSAGGLALLDVVVRSLGAGWCFVLFSGAGSLCLLSLYLLEMKGMSWRRTGQQHIEPPNEMEMSMYDNEKRTA